MKNEIIVSKRVNQRAAGQRHCAASKKGINT